MTGLGGAFALFPVGQVSAHIPRVTVQTRIYNNFRAAGDRLRTAQGKFADGQQEAAQQRK